MEHIITLDFNAKDEGYACVSLGVSDENGKSESVWNLVLPWDRESHLKLFTRGCVFERSSGDSVGLTPCSRSCAPKSEVESRCGGVPCESTCERHTVRIGVRNFPIAVESRWWGRIYLLLSMRAKRIIHVGSIVTVNSNTLGFFVRVWRVTCILSSGGLGLVSSPSSPMSRRNARKVYVLSRAIWGNLKRNRPKH